MTAWQQWAPLPLRLFLGGGLILHGGIKLFASGGHANIAYLVGQLGVPFADAVGWLVGVIEFGGGIGILLGVFFRLATVVNALNVAGLLVLGFVAGGIPAPLPGGDPLPGFREALLILAGLLSLLLSGPGPLTLAGETVVDPTSWRRGPWITGTARPNSAPEKPEHPLT
ncbi:DoxX family membrane protein [Mycolicibacterium neworleansense]|uniref:DoxX n=1 Tax=Mycolicibacterium neworleansense TaxID=146018 RepID=A0A0H5RUN2_9MYCO|nr:DoxX family membrane protein [Mycolicibacterium neworleansense]MCV7362891.1 DoxX family membrane protein [Mycolicibacterium neworleansense]CRZ17638.1 DoxX [Mycolicibacterium neworleansense]